MAEMEIGTATRVSQMGAQRMHPDECRILVLTNIGRCEAATNSASPIRIDRDNIDEVLASFQVTTGTLAYDPEGNPITLSPKCVDDLEPDKILESVPAFEALRTIRRRLKMPKFFDATVVQIQEWAQKSGTTPPAITEANPSTPGDKSNTESKPFESTRSSTADTSPDFSVDSLLDQVLEVSAPEPTASPWQDWISRLVSETPLDTVNPQVDQYEAWVDDVISELMRQILHHTEFVSLERNWRSIKDLVEKTDTSPKLKIYLCPIADSVFSRVSDNADTGQQLKAVRSIISGDNIPGFTPWSFAVVVPSVQFADQACEGVMQELSQIADSSQTAILVGLAGDRSHFFDSEAPASLKSKASSPYLLAVWPSYLIRLPYGAKTRSTESFAFEEIGDTSAALPLLWNSSAVLIALEIGRRFANRGWNWSSREPMRFEGLPIYIRPGKFEAELTPGAQYLLSEREIAALHAIGINPLISIRDTDIAECKRLMATNSETLHGPWQD